MADKNIPQNAAADHKSSSEDIIKQTQNDEANKQLAQLIKNDQDYDEEEVIDYGLENDEEVLQEYLQLKSQQEFFLAALTQHEGADPEQLQAAYHYQQQQMMAASQQDREEANMAQHQFLMAAAAEQHRRQLAAQAMREEMDEQGEDEPFMGLPEDMMMAHGAEHPDPHLWMTPEELHAYKQHMEMAQAQRMHEMAAAAQGKEFAGETLGQNQFPAGAEGMPMPTAASALEMDAGQQDSAQQQSINFTGSWSEWFCSLEGHDFLTLLPREYLTSKFNWLEIRSVLKLPKQRYQEAQGICFSLKAPTQNDLENENFLQLNQDASDMYGLVHARYLNSAEGLAVLYGKYLKGGYGHCPRALCDNVAVLPVGMDDLLRRSRVKVFCPKCEELYIPSTRSVALDGAYFGTSLSHAFLLAYHKQITLPPAVYMYEPKLHGFKLAGKRGSKYYTPVKSGIEDTKNTATVLQRKMKGGENPTFASQEFSVTNANKNNNNNNRTPQTAVTSQALAQSQQQQRKHKKNES